MHLPAGTVVITDDGFEISSLELSRPTMLFGIPLTGTVGLHDGNSTGVKRCNATR